MSTCKKCGAEIVWKPKPKEIGGFFPLENPDGTPHDCEKKAKPPAAEIIGRLDSYTTGSATFTLKGAAVKVYALTTNMHRDWQAAGFLLPPDKHEEVWLGFTKDAKGFILPGYHVESRPPWAAELSDPTKGEIKKPEFRKASEIPRESPPAAPAAESQGPAPEQMSDEELIRKAMETMMPSDRIGCRISLAGMINSVIEMEKRSVDEPKTYAALEADVKRKAIALFLWCDGLTTQNIKREGLK